MKRVAHDEVALYDSSSGSIKEVKVVYHGTLNMPCLKYDEHFSNNGNERLSGLCFDEIFSKQKMHDVLTAVRSCMSGDILNYHDT
jgi:hypothetical protein